MRLTKHHALGNDFLVLLDDVEPSAALARALCDRRRGVGADGLIVGRPPAAVAAAGGQLDVVMVLRNADGSRAEMSGNGVRCLAQAVLGRDGRNRGTVVVATDAGLRRIEVRPTADALTADASVGMGPVTDEAEWSRPLPAELVAQLGPAAGAGLPRYGRFDVGNPHLVILAADPAAVDVERFGALLESQAPGGLNVEFVRPTPGRADAIDLRVWERGAGLTAACGTGATAAASAVHRWGLVGSVVHVRQPGGDVVVTLGPTARLEGPTTYVATIELPASPADSGHPPTDDGAAEPRITQEVVHG